MIRGTTPTFQLTVNGVEDLTPADHVYVTIQQGPVTLTLTGDELEISQNVISCFLTQDKSMQLIEQQKAKLQVNWTYAPDSSGIVKRAATRVKEIVIGEQLLRRVLPNG